MLVHVRAKARRAAVQRDLPGQAALYQRVEAVVNRGVGNLRHRAFGADENLLGGRVIALLQQHVIDLLPLRREPEPAVFSRALNSLLIFSSTALMTPAK